MPKYALNLRIFSHTLEQSDVSLNRTVQLLFVCETEHVFPEEGLKFLNIVCIYIRHQILSICYGGAEFRSITSMIFSRFVKLLLVILGIN
jgi:hypothetical protein